MFDFTINLRYIQNREITQIPTHCLRLRRGSTPKFLPPRFFFGGRSAPKESLADLASKKPACKSLTTTIFGNAGLSVLLTNTWTLLFGQSANFST